MTFDMLHVRLHGREVYENIVNVSDHELAQHVSKDVTDQALKDRLKFLTEILNSYR